MAEDRTREPAGAGRRRAVDDARATDAGRCRSGGEAIAIMGGGEDERKALTVRRGRDGQAQKARTRKDGWTAKKRQTFMTVLAQTCNVSAAARAAEKCVASAYNERRRNQGFARDWSHALGVGYAELEGILLHEALFGSEQEELQLDADGVVKGRKIRRGRDRGVALRLLLAHRATAAALQAEEMRALPGGEDALARLDAMMAKVREKRGVAEPDG